MKISVLAENTACRSDLQTEHGLSLYIETGNHQILFDMGQTDAFARNARILGIDLTQVEFAVLSHGHYDHGGGLQTFLNLNPYAPVYLHESAFRQYYNGKEKYIGLDPALAENPRLFFTKDTFSPVPGITVQDCSVEEWTFDTYGLYEKQNDEFTPDRFAHEQYMLVQEQEKRIVFSGCSHRGIQNIIRHFEPDMFVGGFHLNKVTEKHTIQEIAKDLHSGKTSYYTGHCTGKLQYAYLKEILGSHLGELSTGTVIEL